VHSRARSTRKQLHNLAQLIGWSADQLISGASSFFSRARALDNNWSASVTWPFAMAGSRQIRITRRYNHQSCHGKILEWRNEIYLKARTLTLPRNRCTFILDNPFARYHRLFRDIKLNSFRKSIESRNHFTFKARYLGSEITQMKQDPLKNICFRVYNNIRFRLIMSLANCETIRKNFCSYDILYHINNHQKI